MKYTTHSDQPHKLILVVEDDEDVGKFIMDALNSGDHYQALLAASAAEALSLLNTLRPDICILDYRLREGTGLELVERLRQMDTFQQLPILLVSAHAPKSIKEREDLTFLEKPFSLDELFTTVEHLLGS